MDKVVVSGTAQKGESSKRGGEEKKGQVRTRYRQTAVMGESSISGTR